MVTAITIQCLTMTITQASQTIFSLQALSKYKNLDFADHFHSWAVPFYFRISGLVCCIMSAMNMSGQEGCVSTER